ncbi:sensor histidine kinase [Agromyces italicus]|uniref:sensor histidine kinase n=1 Tax=Agromyces italicus TaxID=279572 RepID=UPI0003F7ECC7|nr:ATP-binding protein [Agromyces italicus]
MSPAAALETTAVEGDEVLLRQLVVTLVQNAIRHNARGGFVTVTTDATGPAPLLRVENGGAELDAATVATLTAPFARGGGRTRDAADRGRGFGLSIVAAIVARHGAELELSPRPCGGSAPRCAPATDPLSDGWTAVLLRSRNTAEVHPRTRRSGCSRRAQHGCRTNG